MAPRQLTIVTAANAKYMIPLTVMMRSAADSAGPDCMLDFRVLTAGLPASAWKPVELGLQGCNATFGEIVVDSGPLADLKLNGHVSIETYFRLLAPSYIADVESVIYLDADVVVRHSVMGLAQRPPNGKVLLAVPQASRRSGFFCSERGVPSYLLLGIPGMSRTFNAGVMVLELEAWRREGATSTILQYLREFRNTVLWWDQDGLNAILHDKWVALPAKWNVMASHFRLFDCWEDSLLDEDTFEQVRRDPGIVHYSDFLKPWMVGYDGPFLEHWTEALSRIRGHFEEATDAPSLSRRNGK
jgi:UDP-glucose/galactose:(glucosyl)LPS alpha-1,2-glucosyl/galactosyltransferase